MDGPGDRGEDRAAIRAASLFVLRLAFRPISVERDEVTHRQSSGDDYAPSLSGHDYVLRENFLRGRAIGSLSPAGWGTFPSALRRRRMGLALGDLIAVLPVTPQERAPDVRIGIHWLASLIGRIATVPRVSEVIQFVPIAHRAPSASSTTHLPRIPPANGAAQRPTAAGCRAVVRHCR
jgi:hypothetical protein